MYVCSLILCVLSRIAYRSHNVADSVNQESWGQAANETAWGTQWIADHVTSANAANKPAILEEFGVTTNQTGIYQTWYNEVRKFFNYLLSFR
jgi:endo-1,4-beta-mannosidase